MKFLLDENVPPDTVVAVRSIYFTHNWISAHDDTATYCGVDDIDLFAILATEGFDAIVTQDANQLKNHDERTALIGAGLHWIGFKAKPFSGQRGLALRSATLVAGMAYVLEDWRADPHAYTLTGVPSDATQRIKVHGLKVGPPL